jgi:hypothetical protein
MLCGISTKLDEKELAEIGALEEELEEKLGVSLVAVIH